MYSSVPATEISEITGWTLHRVYKTLRAEGVEIKPRGRRPVLKNPGKEALDALKAAEYSDPMIAELYNVSKRTVQRWHIKNRFKSSE